MDTKFSSLVLMHEKASVKVERKRASLQAKAKSLRDEGEKVSRQVDALVFPSWIDGILAPLGEAIVALLPGHIFSVSGPFGMGGHTSLWFKNVKTGKPSLYVTFAPHGDSFAIVDTLSDTGQFPKQSIGAMNGDNHKKVEIPADADAKWFVDWMRQQDRKDRRQTKARVRAEKLKAV